jgi:predicted nucleic acid-binding protein
MLREAHSPAHDLLIGAKALACGRALETLHQRDLGRVGGLRVVDIERYVS